MLEQLASDFLDKSWELHTGYSTVFMAELIRTFGVSNALQVMGGMGRAQAALEKHHSLMIAQLSLGVAGLWNGCRFCGCGHLLAANLLYFRETGKLYPIDERIVLELEKMDFPSVRARIAELLSAPEHQKEAAALDRLMAIQLGAPVADDEKDRALKLGIDVWAIVNECSTVVSFDLDLDVVPALSTIAKDKPLQKRYRIARGRPRPGES